MLCAVVLVVSSVLGTVAYLTDTKTVENTFTVGKVKITMDEAPVDEYGAAITGDRRATNEYKLIPGHKYIKDPTIHVTEKSEDCWVFAKIESGLADGVITTNISNEKWKPVAGTTNVYYYNEKIESAATVTDIVVFTEFTVDGAIDNDELDDNDGKTVAVTGYAVQADGFATAEAAWVATYGAPQNP